MAVDYRKLAEQSYNPGYNEKVTALKNQLADQIGSYDSSKVGINTNYNNQVDTQNRNNVTSQNNFSNNVLGRGIARSTVATSGLGEMGLVNDRLINGINSGRTEALNQVENNKTAAQKSYGTTVAGLNSDRLSAISDLARQLQQTALDNDYKKKQYDQSVRQAALDEAYRQKQLAQEKELTLAQLRASQAATARSASNAARKAASNSSKSMASNVAGWKTGIIGIMNDSSISTAEKIAELKAQRESAGVNFSGSYLKDINNFINSRLNPLAKSYNTQLNRNIPRAKAKPKSASYNNLLTAKAKSFLPARYTTPVSKPTPLNFWGKLKALSGAWRR